MAASAEEGGGAAEEPAGDAAEDRRPPALLQLRRVSDLHDDDSLSLPELHPETELSDSDGSRPWRNSPPVLEPEAPAERQQRGGDDEDGFWPRWSRSRVRRGGNASTGSWASTVRRSARSASVYRYYRDGSSEESSPERHAPATTGSRTRTTRSTTGAARSRTRTDRSRSNSSGTTTRRQSRARAARPSTSCGSRPGSPSSARIPVTRSGSTARGRSPQPEGGIHKRRSRSLAPPAKRVRVDASPGRRAPSGALRASADVLEPKSPEERHGDGPLRTNAVQHQTAAPATSPTPDLFRASPSSPAEDRTIADSATDVGGPEDTAVPGWLTGAAKIVASMSAGCGLCVGSGHVSVDGTAYFDLCDCLAALDGVDRVGAVGCALWALSGQTLKLDSVRFRVGGSDLDVIDALLRIEARRLRRVDARFVPDADAGRREETLRRRLGEMAGVVRQRRRRPGARGPWCPLCLRHGVARTSADHKAPPCQYLFCWCWSCQTGSPFTREFRQQHGVTEFLVVKTADVRDFVDPRDASGEGDRDVVCLDDDDSVVVLDDDDSVVVLYDEQDGVVVDLADDHNDRMGDRGTKAPEGISPGDSTPETAASGAVPRTPTPDVVALQTTALPEAVSPPAAAATTLALPTTSPSSVKKPTVIAGPSSPGPRLTSTPEEAPAQAPDEVSDEAALPPQPPSPVVAASGSRRRHALRQRRVRSADATAVSSEHIEQLLDSLPHSLAASMERGTRYCACCRNHGLAARLAGHSCPFAYCPCGLCVSTSAPASAPAPSPVGPVSEVGVRPRFCARCRAHGQTTPLSGHRAKCPHTKCECSECVRTCRDRRARAVAFAQGTASAPAPPHSRKTVLRLTASVLPPLSDVTPPSSEPSLSPVLDDLPPLGPPPLMAMSPPWSPASPEYSLLDSADESLVCRWCGQQFDDRAGLEKHCVSHVTPESDADTDGAPAPCGVSEAADMPTVEDVAVGEDAVGKENGVEEAGELEDAVVEAGVVAAGVVETGVVEAGVEEAGVEGAGVEEAGVVEAGVEEAGELEDAVEEAGELEDTVEEAGKLGDAVEDAPSRVEEEPPSCEECGLQGPSRLSLARHALTAHALPWRYKCLVCGACFSSRWRLQLHAGLEHRGLSERCDRCPDRFPTPLLVNVHLLVDHKTAVLLSCPSCSAKFATIRSLRAHLDGEPDADAGSECSPPRCEVCAGGPFPDVAQLLVHHHRHLADVRASHCAVCAAWFPTVALLQAHEAYAHGDPPQFACPVARCGVFAPTAEALSLHQYSSHRHRRPYRCPCGKAFSRLNRFSQHVVKSLHMLPVVRGPAGAGLTHTCARCGLTADDLVHIRDHEAVSHMGLLPMDRVAQLMTLFNHARLVSAAQ